MATSRESGVNNREPVQKKASEQGNRNENNPKDANKQSSEASKQGGGSTYSSSGQYDEEE